MNSISSKSDSTFTLTVRSESFAHNARVWLLFYSADETENNPLLRFLFLAIEINFSMLSHCMFSKFTKSSFPLAFTATHFVKVRTKMVWRTLWSGINAAMSAALFSAFTTPREIAYAWAAADTFVFCAAPWMISAAWAAVAVFAFCARIMYQIRVKHASQCYHMVTSIWLVLKWVQRSCYLEPCQLHWLISPWFSLPPLNVGHLNLTCIISIYPQAKHVFLLVAMPKAEYRKIYLTTEH